MLALAAALWACASPVQPPPGASGSEIYALQLCANCHGDDGGGKSLGPPLRDLASHWDESTLADFLGDPRGWEERDARLRRLADDHSGTMDPYDNLSVDERRRLARFLLQL